METMSPYEERVWESLTAHWERRITRRGLPDWASSALTTTGTAAGTTARKVGGAVPDAVKKPLERTGGAVASVVLRPAASGALALIELVNLWCLELNNPASVEKLARKQGVELARCMRS